MDSRMVKYIVRVGDDDSICIVYRHPNNAPQRRIHAVVVSQATNSLVAASNRLERRIDRGAQSRRRLHQLGRRLTEDAHRLILVEEPIILTRARIFFPDARHAGCRGP